MRRTATALGARDDLDMSVADFNVEEQRPGIDRVNFAATQQSKIRLKLCAARAQGGMGQGLGTSPGVAVDRCNRQ